MARVEIGAVFHGCRVVAGPVPFGTVTRWALVCTVCENWFSGDERGVREDGCSACAARFGADEHGAFRAARATRAAVQAAAHREMNAAIRAGLLVRSDTCQGCGRRVPVNGHHESYAHPTQVAWLCDACHGARHSYLRAERIDPFAGTPGATHVARPISVPAGRRIARSPHECRYIRTPSRRAVGAA